jgi:hypothetical protein
MAYKIIYIEDLDPGSIIHDLEQNDFKVDYHNPSNFEETIKAIIGYDLILFDFRLTESKALFDAPTIAQTLRTLNTKYHMDIPMILISSEPNISDYYKDLTSQDLFDLSLTKGILLKNVKKYSLRFKSFIKSYNTIESKKFNIQAILEIDENRLKNLDYRIIEKLNDPIHSIDVFAFSSFIIKNLIQSFGVLFGEDVLSARLGVSKESKDWEAFKELFDDFKYKGVFSDSYNRWWSDGLINWWKLNNDGENNLRQLNAKQRVSKLKLITKLDLVEQTKTKYAKSSSFWTICKETSLPIDPIDGLELLKKDLLPWQETEYISIQAGFEPQKFNAIGEPIYLKYLKPIEHKRLKLIGKNL